MKYDMWMDKWIHHSTYPPVKSTIKILIYQHGNPSNYWCWSYILDKECFCKLTWLTWLTSFMSICVHNNFLAIKVLCGEGRRVAAQLLSIVDSRLMSEREVLTDMQSNYHHTTIIRKFQTQEQLLIAATKTNWMHGVSQSGLV